MEKIRTLIVDDEPLARRGIRAHLNHEKDFEIVSECRNGREAVEAISAYAPDLVFLDVQMPELDGFRVVETVGVERMPAVVFVTAYDRYALRAFDVHALDYLLKPFDDERFARTLERARRQVERNGLGDLGRSLQGLLDDLKPRKYVERFAVKSGERISFLSVADIHWIEAADNYVRLHAGRESHLLRETMNGLEKKLDPDHFLRIHRSHIVNIRMIKELQPLFRGEYNVLLQNGTSLESGRRYRDQIQKLLN